MPNEHLLDLSQFNRRGFAISRKRLIDPKRLRDGKVIRTTSTLPDDLASVFVNAIKRHLLIEFLTTAFFWSRTLRTERSSSANRPIWPPIWYSKNPSLIRRLVVIYHGVTVYDQRSMKELILLEGATVRVSPPFWFYFFCNWWRFYRMETRAEVAIRNGGGGNKWGNSHSSPRRRCH